VIQFDSINQFRENSVGDREFPWLNRFHFDSPVPGVPLALSVDGQMLLDAVSKTALGDLFEADLRYGSPVWGGTTVRAGRFLLNAQELNVSIDGVEARFGAKRRVSFRVFGGARRQFEVSDFVQKALLTGGELRVMPLSVTTLTAGLRYQDDFDGIHRTEVTGSLQQAIPILWTPIVYGAVSYLTNGTRLTNLNAGLELHPFTKLRLSGDLSRFSEPNDGFHWQDRIYTLFTRGPLWEERGAVALEVARGVTLSGAYAHQTYDVLAGVGSSGHRGSVGSSWLAGKLPLRFDSELFMAESYGGKAYGFKSWLEKEILRGLRGRARAALAKYDKVTGEKDYAFHSGLGLDYTWARGFKLGADAEFNSNVLQSKDFRAGMVFQYVYF
jgi:hypothetical protein